MRVFHFVNSEFGLDDICHRRLKVATLDDLNDPFEFFGVHLGDANLRRTFQVMKQELSPNRGILCFSRHWHNPVQWSHYAAKHTGLCLGFDVPDEHLGEVNYSPRRLFVEAQKFRNPRAIDTDLAQKLLFTKYSHWRYENEIRSFVSLEDRDPETGLYFADFSERLKLATVIVGAQSTITRSQLQEALGNLASEADCLKARLAFKTFRVVTQRKKALWI